MYSGKNNGAIGDGELPNITGYFTTYEFGRTNNYQASGCFYVTSSGLNGTNGQSDTACGLNFDASRSKSAYSRSDNMVLPRYLVTKYIIKY